MSLNGPIHASTSSLPSPTPYAPSAASLAHRARLAPLISQFRRITPRVPFWQLAAHRIPTLWSLYRRLLRVVPSDEIRVHISAKFRQNRHLTSPVQTKEQLLKAERLMDLCDLAREGDRRAKAILERYSRLIAARREKESWERAALNTLRDQETLRKRPIVTGYFRPSLFHRALPRLKPQPSHISMMISKRRKARAHRLALYPVLRENLYDIQTEAAFEKELLKKAETEPTEGSGNDERKRTRVFDAVWYGSTEQWATPITDHQRMLRESFDSDVSRLQSAFPPALIEKIVQAKKERHHNKLRERRRELRGEILRRTIDRANQGPPAHVLSKMSEEEKKLDKISRSNVSEVGYVGYAKMRRGWKLKESPWTAEDGPAEKEEQSKTVRREIERENRRRRAEWENISE